MSWAKFDDLYDDNRKVKRAWRRNRAAVGLHAMSVTYCARHETDGVVDSEWIEEKLPAAKERAVVLELLVDVGLFEELGEGAYRVHDYLKYNQSREQADAQRRQKAARQAKWRARNASTDTDVDGAVDASPARRGDAAPDPTRPDPTRPDPSRSEPSRPDVDTVCTLLADLIQRNDPKAKVDPASKRWRDAARLLIDNDRRTVDEIEQVIRWCQADQFWQSNVLSMPKLREKFQQLALRMRTEQLPMSRQGAGPTAEDFLAAGGGNP